MSEELRKGIPKATVIGRVEFSEEEKARHRRECEAMLKEMGILEENESIEDYEVNT